MYSTKGWDMQKVVFSLILEYYNNWIWYTMVRKYSLKNIVKNSMKGLECLEKENI